MIDTLRKVEVASYWYDLIISSLLHWNIFFIILSRFLTEFSFNDKWERVRNLVFASENFSYQGSSIDYNRINSAEVRLIKAWLYEALDVEL